MDKDRIQEQLNLAIAICMHIHMGSPKEPKNAVRGHDKLTPYYTHPIGMACLIMEDNNNISFEDRFLLANVALFHDVLEDTTYDHELLKEALLTIYDDKEFIDRILYFVSQATTNGGSVDEFQHLVKNQDNIPEEIWYLKLIDKYWNLIGSTEYFVKKNRLGFYKAFLTYLIEQTSKTRFKDSIYINQAKALLNRL